jgi:peptide/nickel transport system permease protein
VADEGPAMSVARTLLRAIVVLFLVSVIVFLALRLTPGDPALLLLGPQAGRADNAQRLEALRSEMGLDKSWPVQYGIWVSDIVRGDLGTSNRSGQDVLQLVLGALPATAWLIVLAMLVAIPVSIVAGSVAASHRNGFADRAIRLLTTLSIATPGFWLGLILIIVFAVRLGVLPAGTYVSPAEDPLEFVRHMVLPVSTLAVYLVGALTRFVYTEMADVLEQDHVRTTRAMGIAERSVLYRYAARNALIPMIAVVALELGTLIGGAVLVEQVFSLGGLGQLMLNGVLGRDYAIVQGAVVLVTSVILLINVLADLLYRRVDPRIT